MSLARRFVSIEPQKPAKRPRAAAKVVEQLKEKVAAVKPEKKSKGGRPRSGKVVMSIRVDPDVLEKFRSTGPGWQARVNEILKAAKI